MRSAELVPALRVVWRILSFGTAVLLLLPFAIPPATLSSWVPPCEWQLQGRSCSLCGMTTAFYLLSVGDVPGALAANSLSLGLYVCLVVNLAIWSGVTLIALKRKGTHAIR